MDTKKSEPKKGVSLTLRLSDSEYNRLAFHAIKTRRKHQKIIHHALMKYLDDTGA